MLSHALGSAQKHVGVGAHALWGNNSPLGLGRAWAASWVCKLYNGSLLAVSSAKSISVPWTSPVPPPTAACTQLLFCTSALRLCKPSRNQAGTVSSEERNIPQLCPARGRSMVLKYKGRFITWEECRVHFVIMFLILSHLEGKYFITAAVAKWTGTRGHPCGGTACHLDMGTEAEKNDSFSFNHISPVLIQPNFQWLFTGCFMTLWHYSGFTPAFSRQGLTCFTVCCPQPKGLKRHWRWAPKLLQCSLRVPVMGKVWSPLPHWLGKKSWLFVYSIYSQVSGCIHQDFWYNLKQVKCLRTF